MRGHFAIFLSSLVVQFDGIVVAETWLTAEISFFFIWAVTNACICLEIATLVALVFIIIISKLSSVVREQWFPILLKLFRVIMYLSQVIHLSCFYRPPNEYLNHKIFPIISKHVNSMLCGDLNVNLYNPLHLTSIDEFVNSLSCQGYFRLILKPTILSPEDPVTKYSLLDQMWCHYLAITIVSLRRN